MARKPVVSRTFTTYSYTAVLVNRETAEVSEFNYVSTRKINDKKVIKTIENEAGNSYVVLKVSEPATETVKKGMDEAKFFELADVME